MRGSDPLILPQQLGWVQGCYGGGEGLGGGVVGEEKGMKERFVEEVAQGAQVAGVGRGGSFGCFDFEGEIALGKLDEKIHFPAIEGPEVPETGVGTHGFGLFIQLCDNEALEFGTTRAAALLDDGLEHPIIEHVDFGSFDEAFGFVFCPGRENQGLIAQFEILDVSLDRFCSDANVVPER